ncbi:hypothetical protein LCGC14_1686080 [marine sediment metagenome]|uniref:Uncharacterized protein n=1 Tax=marine sediment metagenome TaxID=412755 RepID=A0A0F9KM91_9ZZZZ
MLKYKINRFITLKLENNKTRIYINNEEFEFYCKKLFVSIQTDKFADFDNVKSIDDLDSRNSVAFSITPEEEFWGHCSNIHAWAENNYNTLILHSNIAFPLLKKLNEVGDLIAKNIFKDEIGERFLSENKNTSIFLIEEDYLSFLNEEEFLSLMESYKIFTKRIDIEQIDVYIVLGLSYSSRCHKYLKKEDFIESHKFFQATKIFFEKALDIDQNLESVWNNYGYALKRLERYDEAIEKFKKSVEINPDNDSVWANYGYALNRLGKYNEAIEKFQKSVEINPDNDSAWFNFGYSLYQLGKYEEAIEKLQKSIEINPDNAISWLSFGYTLNKLGKYDEAIEKFQNSVEINPDNAVSWNNYGQALLKLGKHSQAIEKFQKYIEINPKSWNSLVIDLIKMLKEYKYDDWVEFVVAEFINDDLIYNDLDRAVNFLNIEINYCPKCEYLLNPIYKYCLTCERTLIESIIGDFIRSQLD